MKFKNSMLLGLLVSSFGSMVTASTGTGNAEKSLLWNWSYPSNKSGGYENTAENNLQALSGLFGLYNIADVGVQTAQQLDLLKRLNSENPIGLQRNKKRNNLALAAEFPRTIAQEFLPTIIAFGTMMQKRDWGDGIAGGGFINAVDHKNS